MKHIVIAGLLCAGTMMLASCGSIDVTSERPRGITSEQESRQMNERIQKDRAAQAAKRDEAISRGWHVK